LRRFSSHFDRTDLETVVHSDSGFAAVSYLRIKGATLEDKPDSWNGLAMPPLLQADFARIQTLLRGSPSVDISTRGISEPLTRSSPSNSRRGDWVAVGNIYRATGEGVAFEEEVSQCFYDLQGNFTSVEWIPFLYTAALLENHGLSLSQCAHVDVYLSSMDLFPTLNTKYATFFGTSPPTRACVAVDLPPPLRVKLDCFAYAETDPSQRAALHVQGLSYWAPANIGPYSQAVLVDEHMFVSGQIGLVPASLSLPSPQDLATETALAFQHTERVADAVRKSTGQGKGYTQLAIYWLIDRKQAAGVVAACELFAMVGVSLSVSLHRSHLPPGKKHANDVVRNTFFAQGRRNRKAGGPTHRTLHSHRRRGNRGDRRRGAYVPDR
jgi:diphthine-ammonia ligase